MKQAAPSAVASTHIFVTEHDLKWILGLLSVADSLLESSDISTLRTLARTCIEGAELLATGDAADAAQKQIAGCWMVVAAISGIWGQSDIWQP
jgi:hypothetical protein